MNSIDVDLATMDEAVAAAVSAGHSPDMVRAAALNVEYRHPASTSTLGDEITDTSEE